MPRVFKVTNDGGDAAQVSPMAQPPQEAPGGDRGEESTTVGAPGMGTLTWEVPVDNGGEPANTMGVPASDTQPLEGPVQPDASRPVRKRSASEGGLKLSSCDSIGKPTNKKTAGTSMPRTRAVASSEAMEAREDVGSESDHILERRASAGV